MSYDFDLIKSTFNIRDEIIRVLGEPIDTCNKFDSHACPFVAEQSPGALKIYDDHYFCYSCGETGDVLDWFAWANNKSLTEIMKENHLDFTDEQLIERKEEIVKIKLEAKIQADSEYADALVKLNRAEKWIEYHGNLNDTTRSLWRKRGIPDVFQSIWTLGCNPSFVYKTNQGTFTTPSITIPIMSIDGECLNIQHRLQNAMNGDRYRPEGAGLKMHPFLCDTDLKGAQDVIVVEGAIKAMVAYITYDKPGTQVIGALSKSMMNKIVRQLKGRNILVIPDPDGKEEIMDACRKSNARMLKLPDKVDDYILEHDLDKEWLRGVIRQARYV